MWDMTPRKVLVAVESADCDAALELAASEARRRRCGVHLIHVNQPAYGSAAAADAVVLLADQMQRIGTAVLNDAGAKLEQLLVDDDELTVSTELCHGAVVPTLVAESAHASLVIMQHRGMGPDGATAVMSTVNGVAARAHAPVIAVPSFWQPDPQAEAVVSVGVETVEVSAEVVRVALEEAARSAAQLRLVHAFTPTETGDVNLNRAAEQQEARRLELGLSEAYAYLVDGSDVLTGIVAVPAPAVQALLEQARNSTLLVVGRRHPRLPIVSHLGPIARSVLRWSPIPVMVVDPVTPEGIHSATRALSSVAIP